VFKTGRSPSGVGPMATSRGHLTVRYRQLKRAVDIWYVL
jgi:hypothetical protein